MTRRDVPPGFFDRADAAPDTGFYGFARLVTRIDDAAIAAVGDLYAQLQLDGAVLDLMGSSVSHFHTARIVSPSSGEKPLRMAWRDRSRAGILRS